MSSNGRGEPQDKQLRTCDRTDFNWIRLVVICTDTVSCANKIQIQDLDFFCPDRSSRPFFSMDIGARVCAFQFTFHFISIHQRNETCVSIFFGWPCTVSSWFLWLTCTSSIFSCTKAEHVKNTFIHSAATPLAAWPRFLRGVMEGRSDLKPIPTFGFQQILVFGWKGTFWLG